MNRRNGAKLHCLTCVTKIADSFSGVKTVGRAQGAGAIMPSRAVKTTGRVVMKRKWFMYMMAFAVVAAPARASTVDDFQVWTTINLSVAFKPHFVGNLELQSRFSDDATRLATVLIRPSIGYEISRDVVVHVGYLHQATFNKGRPDLYENHYFQQINWRVGKLGRATLNSRTRLELRTVEGASDAGWRLRQRLQLVIPLRTKATNLVVQSEQFIVLNSTSWGARPGIDQMRNFVGVAFPLSNRIALETGFQHRYLRREGIPDRSDYTVPIIVGIKF